MVTGTSLLETHLQTIPTPGDSQPGMLQQVLVQLEHSLGSGEDFTDPVGMFLKETDPMALRLAVRHLEGNKLVALEL